MSEDKKQSFEDELISAFLTKSTEKAKQQIADEGKLSTENAIPLMLKSQYNHIAHLDEQMVTKTEFNAFKEQFNGLKEQVGFIKWMIMLGFALLAALQVYTSFIK